MSNGMGWNTIISFWSRVVAVPSLRRCSAHRLRNHGVVFEASFFFSGLLRGTAHGQFICPCLDPLQSGVLFIFHFGGRASSPSSLQRYTYCPLRDDYFFLLSLSPSVLYHHHRITSNLDHFNTYFVHLDFTNTSARRTALLVHTVYDEELFKGLPSRHSTT